MSEIEKMIENAGVNQVCNTCELRGFKRLCPTKELCVRTNPPFTAEKQLELVKMILFSTWWMNLKRLQFSEKFDEGLAQMINELWQDLTPEEKASIKNILEM